MAIRALALVGVAAASDSIPTWSQYKQQHGLQFNGDEHHFEQNYMANVEFILATNAKDLPYKVGVNQFAHLNQQEYADAFLGFKQQSAERPSVGVHEASDSVPNSVDWTSKGAVTPVKNQGQCGSCWAFSTTGSLEGANFLASGHLVSLSEQELVDCDHVDQGCNGGLMDNGFNFVKNSGLCTEGSYPYVARRETTGRKCDSCDVAISAGSVTGYVDVRGESDLKSAVAQQPVSVAIEADQQSFQLYQSGVLTGECGTQLDHGVLAVGYGSEHGTDYWKVKNSWGASWGEEGYVRIERGVNKCGIAGQPSYPQISSSVQV